MAESQSLQLITYVDNGELSGRGFGQAGAEKY